MNIDRAKRWTGIILGSSASILTIVLYLWYKQNPQLFIAKKLGITVDIFDNFYLWFITLIVALGYIMYTMRVLPFVREHLWTFSLLKLLGIWAALTLSPLEEIVFRQLLMDYLYSLDLSTMTQIIISAVAFGVAHSLWFFLSQDIKIVLPVVLSTTVLGAALAIIYILGGRNIFAPIVAHVIINFAIEPWLILSAIAHTWKDY